MVREENPMYPRSKRFTETFVFDNPDALQIVKGVLDNLKYKYQEPDFESYGPNPVYILQIEAAQAAEHVVRICNRLFKVDKPLNAATLGPMGGTARVAQVWNLKLLGIQFKPEDIPAIVEQLISSAPTA